MNDFEPTASEVHLEYDDQCIHELFMYDVYNAWVIYLHIEGEGGGNWN